MKEKKKTVKVFYIQKQKCKLCTNSAYNYVDCGCFYCKECALEEQSKWLYKPIYKLFIIKSLKIKQIAKCLLKLTKDKKLICNKIFSLLIWNKGTELIHL